MKLAHGIEPGDILLGIKKIRDPSFQLIRNLLHPFILFVIGHNLFSFPEHLLLIKAAGTSFDMLTPAGRFNLFSRTFVPAVFS